MGEILSQSRGESTPRTPRESDLLNMAGLTAADAADRPAGDPRWGKTFLALLTEDFYRPMGSDGLRVLLRCRCLAWGEGARFFISPKEVSSTIGMDYRQVQRSIKKLELLGYLVRTGQKTDQHAPYFQWGPMMKAAEDMSRETRLSGGKR